jgi:hypothetical protein
MADVTFIERWLIDLATVSPPPGRDEWAQAMRAEFEALEHGRARWALGCLGASLDWRLRAHWAFLLAFVAIASCSSLIEYALSCGIILLMPWPIFKAAAYAMNWGALAVESGTFAAIRPRHWIVIGIAMALAQALTGLVEFILLFDKPISFIPHIHLMDAQIDVGIGAYLGYSLIGALLGRTLGGAFRRASIRPRAVASLT